LAQNSIWVLFKMLTESLISSGSMLLSTLCIPNGYAPSTGTGLPFNTSLCFRKNLRNIVCACVAPPPPNNIGGDGFAATKFIVKFLLLPSYVLYIFFALFIYSCRILLFMLHLHRVFLWLIFMLGILGNFYCSPPYVLPSLC